jgi:hypothetical protein
MQSRQHISLHSYHSNARRSQSVPPIIVYTLVLYATYLSLIIFKIIPHPMTLLIAIPLQVIILHFIQYCLFPIAYYHLTYLLPCSHIPSLCVRLTLRLTLPHSIKHVLLFLKTKSSPPFISYCLRPRNNFKPSSYVLAELLVLVLISRAHHSYKVINN